LIHDREDEGKEGHWLGQPGSTFGAPGYPSPLQHRYINGGFGPCSDVTNGALCEKGPDAPVHNVAGADEGEPEEAGQPEMDDALREYNEAHADVEEELGETVMCPQTKRGVPCTRELHNVGLHQPEGWPENGSWTDKESD